MSPKKRTSDIRNRGRQKAGHIVPWNETLEGLFGFDAEAAFGISDGVAFPKVLDWHVARGARWHLAAIREVLDDPAKLAAARNAAGV